MFTLLYLVLLVCAIAQQQPTLRIALRHNDWIPIQPERACQVVRCLWTANHELNELSDLVITMHHMHDRHYRQYPGQLLAFLELEPPIHGSYGADARTSYERGFDWKIDYMKNSDVRLTYTPTTLQFDGGPYKTAVKDPRWLALAVISNCKDGDRLDYIEQMMRVPNMTILSVGKCLNTVNGSSTASLFPDCATDSRMQEKLCLMSKVFFQLAFENSRYDDYVTEKLFQTYDSHTIPVYRGAVNAQEMVPALHSTIFADDFGSPAALATFLVSLARNQTAYEDYFAWKRLGSSGLLPEFLKMQNSSLDNFQCNTCRTLQRWLEAKPEEFTRVPKRELELRRLLRLASDTSNVGNVVGNSSSNSSSSGTNNNNRAKSRAILLATVDRHGLANATRWIQSLLALPIPRPPFLLVALDNVTYSSLTTGSLASLTALPPLGPASSLSFRVVPFWLLLLVHTNFQDMDGAQDLQAMMLGDDGDNDGAALDLKARASSCLKPFVVSALLDQGYKVLLTDINTPLKANLFTTKAGEALLRADADIDLAFLAQVGAKKQREGVRVWLSKQAQQQEHGQVDDNLLPSPWSRGLLALSPVKSIIRAIVQRWHGKCRRVLQDGDDDQTALLKAIEWLKDNGEGTLRWASIFL